MKSLYKPQESSDLTPRQIEIVELVAEGLFNYEIAKRLWIEEKTVKNHLQIIFKKLKARNRVDLVIYYFKQKYESKGENR